MRELGIKEPLGNLPSVIIYHLSPIYFGQDPNPFFFFKALNTFIERKNRLLPATWSVLFPQKKYVFQRTLNHAKKILRLPGSIERITVNGKHKCIQRMLVLTEEPLVWCEEPLRTFFRHRRRRKNQNITDDRNPFQSRYSSASSQRKNIYSPAHGLSANEPLVAVTAVRTSKLSAVAMKRRQSCWFWCDFAWFRLRLGKKNDCCCADCDLQAVSADPSVRLSSLLISSMCLKAVAWKKRGFPRWSQLRGTKG